MGLPDAVITLAIGAGLAQAGGVVIIGDDPRILGQRLLVATDGFGIGQRFLGQGAGVTRLRFKLRESLWSGLSVG